MNAKAIFDRIVNEITLNESRDEIQSIAYILLEKFFGINRTGVLADRIVDNLDLDLLKETVNRINRHEPIQYILGETVFLNRVFFVNKHVLIPRPETEQLVLRVVAECGKQPATILDIGTGSGCIAVSIACALPSAVVHAVDVSLEALVVAAQNADDHHASVSFRQVDVLKEQLPYRGLTVIVSNPPYIRASEHETMQRNVLDFEPHLALFVPDHDALVFYTAIARHAEYALLPGGKILVEINEHLGVAVCEVFRQHGFVHTSVEKDIFGKDRIVIASK